MELRQISSGTLIAIGIGLGLAIGLAIFFFAARESGSWEGDEIQALSLGPFFYRKRQASTQLPRFIDIDWYAAEGLPKRLIVGTNYVQRI